MSEEEGTPYEGGEDYGTDSSAEYDEPVEAQEAEGGQDEPPAQSGSGDDDEEGGGLRDLIATKGIPDAKGSGPRPLVSKKKGPEKQAKAPSSGAFDPVLAEDFKRWKEAQLQAGADPAKVQGQANAIAAQMRIRDRENKILRAKLLEIERQKNAPKPAEEEQLPDPNADPGAYAIAKLDRLEKMIREREEREYVQKEVESHLGKVSYARNLAIQYRENNPQVYDEAVMHLASSAYDEMSDNIDQLAANGLIDVNQDIQPQLIQLVARSLASKMTQAVDNGHNPGEILYQLAVRRGYQPRQWFAQQQAQYTQQQQVQQPQPQAKPDARQVVESERARQQKAASISSIPAAGPGRLNLNRLASMEDIDEYLDATKGIPMKELFKDKLIPGAR